MKILRSLLLRTALVAVLFVTAPAWASDILITLDINTFSGSPGDVLTFTGTLQNLDSSTVDLNGCQINMAGQFATDCSPFFNNAPFTLDPLGASTDFAMFTITVNLPYTDPAGLQSGSFDVLGGVEGNDGYDGTTQNLLGTADFSVNETDAVPEPGTAALLGLAGLFLLAMRRKAAAL